LNVQHDVTVTVLSIIAGTDWVDPDDPTVIAENELLGAAASIDAAAKKLASLRPRRSVQVSSLKCHSSKRMDI
jgi:talin